jgi:hypothetical protein
MSAASRTSIFADRNSHGVKRRQIRKGTFSCWECKRRKTKCELKEGSNLVCASCQRRGTPCVGQDMVDSMQDIENVKRIDQIESLVDQLIRKRGQNISVFKPLISIEDENARLTNHSSPFLLSTTNKLLSGNSSLSAQLYAVLPIPNEMRLILSRGKFSDLPINLNKQLTLPNEFAMEEHLTQTAELPSPTAHPIHFARKLIQLGLCYQQMSTPDHDVSKQYLEIASRFVTSQDYLMQSNDGVEVLVSEASYYINIGDLPRAWLLVRRAISISQSLAVSPNTNTTRQQTCSTQLLLADRVLSWMLGLPVAIAEDPIGNLPRQVSIPPLVELRRIHTSIFGRIIKRNVRMQRCQFRDGKNSMYDDSTVSRDIDQDLKRALRLSNTDLSRLSASLEGLAPDKIVEQSGRVLAQVEHAFLLIILNQPYLVKSCAYPTSVLAFPFSEAYTRQTVLYASRELLSLFIPFRAYHSSLTYRGFDDKVFVACAMLLLIYIDAHRYENANVLDHQRPGDISICSEAVKMLENTSLTNKDKMSSSMARVLKKLQKIEADAAEGHHHLLWIEEISVQNDRAEIEEDESALSLPIPYFGVMRVSCQATESVAISTDLFESFDIGENVPPDVSSSDTLSSNLTDNMSLSTSFDQALPIDSQNYMEYMNSWLGQEKWTDELSAGIEIPK